MGKLLGGDGHRRYAEDPVPWPVHPGPISTRSSGPLSDLYTDVLTIGNAPGSLLGRFYALVVPQVRVSQVLLDDGIVEVDLEEDSTTLVLVPDKLGVQFHRVVDDAGLTVLVALDQLLHGFLGPRGQGHGDALAGLRHDQRLRVHGASFVPPDLLL